MVDRLPGRRQQEEQRRLERGLETSLVRFDPPKALAQVHEQDRHGARLGLPVEWYGLLDDEPMKRRKANGVEILALMRSL